MEANGKAGSLTPEAQIVRQRERKRLAAQRRRRISPDSIRQINATYRERNRTKVRARSLVGKHIERGKLHRPDHCPRCLKPCVPQAHHADHSKPLAIDWLCRDCHWEVERLGSSITPKENRNGSQSEVRSAPVQQTPQ